VIGGSSSSIATGLKKPTSVTSDGLGNVYVVEEGLHRVWKFSPTLGSLIAAPNMPRDAVPVSITADRDGNFIVATRGSGIVRFSLSTTVAGM
jgi:streptogramin lyase